MIIIGEGGPTPQEMGMEDIQIPKQESSADKYYYLTGRDMGTISQALRALEGDPEIAKIDEMFERFKNHEFDTESSDFPDPKVPEEVSIQEIYELSIKVRNGDDSYKDKLKSLLLQIKFGD